jgi:hypothetical protein
MPFADNLTTRTVVGTFVTPRGVPADGYITFTPQVTTHNTENDNLILHSPVKKNLDASGSFSVELVDTDNADLLPSGWGYSIEYRATGIPNRVFFAYVPAGDDELNVADLIPLDVEDIDPDLYTPHSIVYGNSGGVPTTMTIPQDSVVGRLNSGVVTIPIADLDSPEAMLYLGAWDNETAYAQYSVVSYDDALWVWPTDDESTVGEAPDTDNGWFAVSGGAATIESIDGLQDALDAKATPGDITTAIDEVLDSAPGALDTLNELAAALGDDANFATTVTNALAGKADSTDLDAYALLSGLGTMATATASDYLSKAGNLSGIADPAAARTNLSLGDSATRDVGTTAGTVAAGDDSRLTGALQASGNLAAIADAATARANLGLGTMATQSASAYAVLTGATFTGALRGPNGSAGSPGLAVSTAGSYDSGIQGDGSGFYMVAQGQQALRAHSSLGLMAYMKMRPPGDNPAAVVLRTQGAAAQTANLQTWENSSATVLASISAAGAGTFNGLTVAAGYDINAAHAAGDTNTRYGLGALRAAATGGNNTAIGYYSLIALTGGTANTAVGKSALQQVTSGVDNTAVGEGAGLGIITTSANVAIGRSAISAANGAANNTAVGYYAMAIGTGAPNGVVAVGRQAGYAVTGNNNTFLGSYSGFSATSGAANIFIGREAGYYSTTQSNELFINSIGRTDRAGDIAKSIIYGVQDAVAANQTLTLNAAVTATYGLTANANAASVVPLVAKGYASHNADFFTVQNSAGTKLGGWDKYGQLNTQYVTDLTGASPYIRFQSTSLIAINQGNAANVAFAVRGMAAQSGALTRWEDSSSTLLASVSAAGAIKGASIGPVSASTFNILDNTGGAVATARTTDFLVNYRLIAGSTTGTEAFKSVGNSLLTVSNAAHIPVQVRGHASQTANLQRWEDSSGLALSYVKADGTFHIGQTTGYGALELDGGTGTGAGPYINFHGGGTQGYFGYFGRDAAINGGSSNNLLLYASYGFVVQRGSRVLANMGTASNTFTPYDAAAIPVVAKGYTSQSASLTEWQDSSGTVLSKIDSAGAFVGGSVVAVTLWNRTVQGTGGGSLYLGGSATGAATDSVVLDGNASPFVAGVTSGEWSSLRVGHNNNPNASSTAIHNAIKINPVINYASGGTGSYNALRIAVTETALPSGANYLIRASAGVAGTTDKFTVKNDGAVVAAGLGTFNGLVLTDTATVNVTESDKGFRVVDSSISHAGALYRDQISIGGSQAGGSAGAIFYANSDGDGIATANLVLNTVGVLGYNGITLSGSIDGNTNTTSTWYIENQITASAYGLKIRHEKGSGAPGVDAAIDISENLELITVASTTTNAGIRLPHGVAPTSPVDGQMWTDTGGVKTRINGVTENVVGSTTLLKMEALTQAAYDLLTPDANTFYIITDA